jgi:hypothetical protein
MSDQVNLMPKLLTARPRCAEGVTLLDRRSRGHRVPGLCPRCVNSSRSREAPAACINSPPDPEGPGNEAVAAPPSTEFPASPPRVNPVVERCTNSMRARRSGKPPLSAVPEPSWQRTPHFAFDERSFRPQSPRMSLSTDPKDQKSHSDLFVSVISFSDPQHLVLDPVAARRHVAPSTPLAMRSVVVGPTAFATAACLETFPCPIALGVAHNEKEPHGRNPYRVRSGRHQLHRATIIGVDAESNC